MLEAREERELIIRDKAAREGFVVPQEVCDYLVDKFDTEQNLKAALINVAMYAAQHNCAIDLPLAQLVIDGTRPRAAAGTPAGAMEVVPEEAAAGAAVAAVAPTPEVVPEVVPTVSELGEPAEALDFEPDFEQTSGADALFTADEDLFADETSPVAAPHDVSGAGGTQAALDFGFGPTSFPAQPEEPQSWPSAPGEEASGDDDAGLDSLPHEEIPVAVSVPEPAVVPAAPVAATPAGVAGAGGDAGHSAAVYFMPVRTERKRSMLERIVRALDRCGLEEMISAGDKVAVKVHFGEMGNTAFVSPLYARAVVERIKELGGKPFLTDANTLYSGMRTNAIDHLNCALANGFGYATVGAPLIIADGLVSRDSVEVAVPGAEDAGLAGAGGTHFSTVRIASAVVDADAMVVLSHVKGHAEAGFGAAIKNVGMGLGCRSAKQRMHSGIKPRVDFAACTACGRCVDWCPEGAAEMRGTAGGGRHAYIKQATCNGCGECIAACAYEAIAVNWESTPEDFLEKTVEHAAGVLAGFAGDGAAGASGGDTPRKVAYLNFLTNITPDCDCWVFSDAALVPDIGVLASRDIVAIDQASLDLVTAALGSAGSRAEGVASGVEKFHAIHGVDPSHSMAYGELLGLGSRRYHLKQVG